MNKGTVGTAGLEPLKSLTMQDKKDFVKAGPVISEEILNKVIETANSVEEDCRMKPMNCFAFLRQM